MRFTPPPPTRRQLAAVLSALFVVPDSQRPSTAADGVLSPEAARSALGESAGRVAGLGGGADMLTALSATVPDVLFPVSLSGIWICRRNVVSIEGDSAQAAGAWRLLGGYEDVHKPETYVVRFVDGGADGVVLDRGFEVDSRVRGATVSWDRRHPNELSYARTSGGRGSAATIRVVQRSAEAPSEKGWGSNELIRVTTNDGSLFGPIDYAVRVQRRYRRANDETGARIVEGLEIMKTYRVLDGIAGVEYPTSTTKSTRERVEAATHTRMHPLPPHAPSNAPTTKHAPCPASSLPCPLSCASCLVRFLCQLSAARAACRQRCAKLGCQDSDLAWVHRLHACRCESVRGTDPTP